jgi:membrane fusion protein (multidrug efflux system)
MRSFFAYLLAIAIVAAGVALGFLDLLGGAQDQAQGAGGRQPAPVVVSVAERAPFADSLEALGTALANESVRLNSSRADHVVKLYFEDGQPVAKGALLVELNHDEEQAMLAEAEALLADRRAAHERAVELFGQQIGPQSEVDSAKAQLDAARARVAVLQAQIADHLVRAPFAGRLGLRQVSIGTFVQPTTVIATLDDLAVVKVDFTIPETWLAAVRVGMPVAARTDAWPGEVFPGQIAAIDTRLDPRTRSATVRARVPNEGGRLLPGMLIKVVVDRGEQAVLGFVEVRSGLADGARVVVEGLVRVRDGEPVDVVAVRESRS